MSMTSTQSTQPLQDDTHHEATQLPATPTSPNTQVTNKRKFSDYDTPEDAQKNPLCQRRCSDAVIDASTPTPGHHGVIAPQGTPEFYEQLYNHLMSVFGNECFADYVEEHIAHEAMKESLRVWRDPVTGEYEVVVLYHWVEAIIGDSDDED